MKTNSNKIAHLLFLVAVVLVAGCASKRTRITNQVSEAKKDSISYIERLRIDTVTVPGEKVTVSVMVDCDSLGRVKPVKAALKGKNSTATASIDSTGKLQVDCECLEYKAAIAAKDRQLTAIKQQQTTRVSEKEIQVKFVPWYYKLCLWLAVIGWGFILLSIILKRLKFF